MYQRWLSVPLENQKSFFLFGPRGTGKTTWLRRNIEESLYIDLLKSDYYDLLIRRPSRLEELIPAGYKHWVILDEVQRIPELLNEVHRLIESRGFRFILTGSSARKLRRAGVNLLAGRARTYYMFPLTVAELGADFSLEHVLRYGFLPEVMDDSNPAEYLRAYVSNYIREEVLQEGLIQQLGPFSRFLEVASFSQGSVLTMSEIAREAQLPQSTISHYFSVLEDLLLGHRLPVFQKHSKRRMLSHPKFYLFDVGVYHTIRPKGILDHGSELEGVRLESICLQELMALNHYLGHPYQLYYWRTSSGQEVDFILYGEERLIAIEVKRSRELRAKDMRGISAFLKDYPMAEAYVFYGGSVPLYQENVTVLPFEQALRTLPQEMFGVER